MNKTRKKVNNETKKTRSKLKPAQKLEKIFNQASDKFISSASQQKDLIREYLPELGRGKMSRFKVRIQDSGRIVIPEAEREIYGFKKGNIVQVIVWKLNKTK